MSALFTPSCFRLPPDLSYCHLESNTEYVTLCKWKNKVKRIWQGGKPIGKKCPCFICALLNDCVRLGCYSKVPNAMPNGGASNYLKKKCNVKKCGARIPWVLNRCMPWQSLQLAPLVKWHL